MRRRIHTVTNLLLMVLFLFIVIACKDNKSKFTDNQVVANNNMGNTFDENENKEEQFDIIKYLRGNAFTLNGNGRVNFNVVSSGVGNIMISGNGNTLTGTIVILNNSSFKVRSLVATGGNYDASNNSDSFGTLYINFNGDIRGTLMDGRGNSSTVLLKLMR
ncbi:hypothetical protein SAMN05443667_105264 [Flavobacterium gillisiae]|uniref:Uncharacterized protein n=1 Tax=Flavobacterium gillisiae TaxID=150146 RepID=A0A1H4C8I1_9FLAO|nr:hypothetical protein [Flavobacterium gillisiae]SEA56392.1 hypothetical protein SAMN05443667_105264 [Flavobacterium gillisiae]